MSIKEDWLKSLKEHNLEFIVIKIEELLDSLSEEEIEIFLCFLDKYESHREKLNKPRKGEYY